MTLKSTLMAGGLVAAATLLATAATAAPAFEQSAKVTAASASQSVNVTVFLPLTNVSGLKALIARQQDTASSDYHKWLTPDQFKTQFGPNPASVARVVSAMKLQGFAVSTNHTQSITFVGSAASAARAFSTSLSNVQQKTGSSRVVANGPLVLPAALKAEGAVVTSFAPTPLLRPMSSNLGVVANPDNRYSESGGYWFTDLKQAYSYPRYGALTNGHQVNVAIVMENDTLDADLTKYLEHEKFSTVSGKPDPVITHRAIDGGAPFDANSSAESSLDVQQVVGGAPGSRVTLFNVPDLSNQSIYDAYQTIVDENVTDLVNSSFGGCELEYSPAYNGGMDFYYLLDYFEDVFMQGNAQGITFVASSGDEAGLGCPSPNYFDAKPKGRVRWVAGTSWPAVSPSVTAVGGGNLVTTTPVTSGDLTSKYKQENGSGDPEVPYDPFGFGTNVYGGYWGAGGGISDHFSQPKYQTSALTGSSTKRTVPDIGMQVGGCPGGISQTPCGTPRSFVYTVIGNKYYGLIGTSVSSPEFVGAVAIYEQANGRQGNLNSYLYARAAEQNSGTGDVSYHRPAKGYDGLYSISQPNANYNYIFGNGSPIVNVLFKLGSVVANDPQTKTNP